MGPRFRGDDGGDEVDDPTSPQEDFRDEELLADVMCRLIGEDGQNVRHIAVGAQSPIPATAALLARERANLNNASGRPYVSLLGSRAHTFFTDGARELFDCAGQGRVDAFFLSGGQIDGAGNINLVSVGDYDHPQARFPGSFGSAYLYYVVPKVILFRTEHSRRTLVPKVDFVSAPGASPDNVFRAGGPIALVTNRCLFDFARARRRFRLASVHPGHSVEEVIENTGFDFDRPTEVPETPTPSADTLHLMRTVVAPMLAEVYPQFAKTVFGTVIPGRPAGPNPESITTT
jgi:glutaconate CoA-transferase, subunit B